MKCDLRPPKHLAGGEKEERPRKDGKPVQKDANEF